jgi:hypothetical protein
VAEQNVFDLVKVINDTKVDLMAEDPSWESVYVPFVVNRQLSYFPDTVLYANEMNTLHHAENRLQFSYLLNSIRPKKRFSRWLKPEKSADLDAIKQYYGYGNQKAREALMLLTGEQLSFIHAKLDKGGARNGRGKRNTKGDKS